MYSIDFYFCAFICSSVHVHIVLIPDVLLEPSMCVGFLRLFCSVCVCISISCTCVLASFHFRFFFLRLIHINFMLVSWFQHANVAKLNYLCIFLNFRANTIWWWLFQWLPPGVHAYTYIFLVLELRNSPNQSFGSHRASYSVLMVSMNGIVFFSGVFGEALFISLSLNPK